MNLDLTRLETIWLLRRLRGERERIHEEMMKVEERLRTRNDLHLADGYRALDADAAVADQLIRKLWVLVAPRKSK